MKDKVQVIPLLKDGDTDFVEVQICLHPLTGNKCIAISQEFACHSAKIYLNVENIPAFISIVVNGGLEIKRNSK
jgi:hypothetical protein